MQVLRLRSASPMVLDCPALLQSPGLLRSYCRLSPRPAKIGRLSERRGIRWARGQELYNIGLDLTNTDAAHGAVPPLCLLSAFAAQANVGQTGTEGTTTLRSIHA